MSSSLIAIDTSRWEKKKLSDLGKLFCGQSPSTKDVNTTGIGTVYVTGPEQWNGSKVHLSKWTTDPKRVVPEGCIFITVKGAGVGKTFPGIACAIGRDVYAFKPHDNVSEKFIYWAIIYSVQDVIRHAVGDIPGISKGHILDHEILVPLTLEEQQEIVAEIEKQFSRLDEAVTALKRIQANLKRYKAAVLKAAVEGKLTEQWRKDHPDVEPADQLLKRILVERRAKWEAEELAKMKAKGSVGARHDSPDSWKKKYKEPAGPDTANLPELPGGWVWASAEQISDFITKGTTPSATKLLEGGGDVRFLKVYNLTFSGRLNYNFKPAFVDQSVHQGELARSRVVAGDVLINIVGPPLGQVSIVPAEIVEANINQAIARYRPINGLSNRFLAYTLMTDSVMSWAIKRAKTTAGQSNLTLELCRELPIPLPSFSEQVQTINEIDRRLSVTEELEATIETNLKRAERLRQTILQQAFSGGVEL